MTAFVQQPQAASDETAHLILDHFTELYFRVSSFSSYLSSTLDLARWSE